MELIIVTGVSGAGKTIALKTLEDYGYYCVDNLPVFLIPQIAGFGMKNKNIRALAIGIDTRVGEDLEKIPEIYEHLDKEHICYRTIFLDASDSTVINRYKETRRAHPLAGSGRIEDGLFLERKKLSWIKNKADVVIDTTNLLTRELRSILQNLISENRKEFKSLIVTVMSFGFKYGLPDDADMIFDVRFLPNPYYEQELKDRTGKDPEVSAFCLENPTGKEFTERLFGMTDFLIPQYIQEGKNRLMIAVGCTGGKHRSVAVAEALTVHFMNNPDIIVKSIHRDIAN